eukprot:scaffold117761_cov75-Phaeocystis_antarctica.AAC.2
MQPISGDWVEPVPATDTIRRVGGTHEQLSPSSARDPVGAAVDVLAAAVVQAKPLGKPNAAVRAALLLPLAHDARRRLAVAVHGAHVAPRAELAPSGQHNGGDRVGQLLQAVRPHQVRRVAVAEPSEPRDVDAPARAGRLGDVVVEEETGREESRRHRAAAAAAAHGRQRTAVGQRHGGT